MFTLSNTKSSIALRRVARRLSGCTPRHLGIKTVTTASDGFFCDVDAEPLQRYRLGGYHPVHLGDQFKEGKYRVIHKLGWGGYSTVWLARDLPAARSVALKVLVAEINEQSQEIELLKLLSTESKGHPGRRHLSHLLDTFDHCGPNGVHRCMVLEVSGASVQAQVQRHRHRRFPGSLAWAISKQVVLALDFLHSNGICHGELHTGNITISHGYGEYSNLAILDQLDEAVRADVYALPNHKLTKSQPRYIVEPTALPHASDASQQWHVELIDLGQAFQHGRKPKAVYTPLVFRAPELIFNAEWNHRIDIWALGCTLFELVTGQPPFDNIMPEKGRLIQEWIATFGELPAEWNTHQTAQGSADIDAMSINDWLHDCYFDGDRHPHFAEEHIECLGDLLTKMMCYRPDERPDTHNILKHPWFSRNPFDVVERLPHSAGGS